MQLCLHSATLCRPAQVKQNVHSRVSPAGASRRAVQVQAAKDKKGAFVEGSDSPNPLIIVLGTGAALAAVVLGSSLFLPKYDDHVQYKYDSGKAEAPEPLAAGKAPTAYGGSNPAPSVSSGGKLGQPK